MVIDVHQCGAPKLVTFIGDQAAHALKRRGVAYDRKVGLEGRAAANLRVARQEVEHRPRAIRADDLYLLPEALADEGDRDGGAKCVGIGFSWQIALMRSAFGWRPPRRSRSLYSLEP